MSRHEAVSDTARRVTRTIVQVGIPAFLGFALVLPQVIDALGLPVDSAVYLWLIGAAGVVTAVAGALSRVMAIPAVDAWLDKVGLSTGATAPALIDDSNAETVATEADE